MKIDPVIVSLALLVGAHAIGAESTTGQPRRAPTANAKSVAGIDLELKTQDPAQLIAGTAAKMKGRLIKVRDAHFFRALQRFMDIKDFRKIEHSPLLIENEIALKKTVQKRIFEEMVYAEVQSFQLETIARSDVKAALEKQKRKDGAKRLWSRVLKRFHRTEKQAIDQLLKTRQVRAYVEKKVETLTPFITDVEVERYLKQNAERFKGADKSKLRPNIKLFLKKQRVEKGLEEWIRFLKKKYQVTNHLES